MKPSRTGIDSAFVEAIASGVRRERTVKGTQLLLTEEDREFLSAVGIAWEGTTQSPCLTHGAVHGSDDDFLFDGGVLAAPEEKGQ